MSRKLIVIISSILLVIIAITSNLIVMRQKEFPRFEQHKNAVNIEDSGSIQSGDLVSHLPLISIDTHGQEIPGLPIFDEIGSVKEYTKTEEGLEDITVNVQIFDNEKQENSINNVPNLECNALFRYRGNSSRNFDKKSFKIEFIDDNQLDVKNEVMGMSADSEWALNGPFLDKTLIRNYMWLNISAHIMGYAPNVRFCECYIDGEYRGVYLMMETIKQSKSRVNISSYKENSRVSSYLVKMDRVHSFDTNIINSFTDYTSRIADISGMLVVYPGKNTLTEEVRKYIENDLSKFEKALYSYDFQDAKKGYEKYIDVESWVDYYIIQEFTANYDMCIRSTFLYKDAGGKLTMGPVWDFNNMCDNYFDTVHSPEDFYFSQRIWYERLMKDSRFVKKVQKKYRELRKTYLNEEYLDNYIDETVEYLGKAIDRNYEVWGYTFERDNQVDRTQYLYPIERNPESFEEAIKNLKTFIRSKGKWLDKNIDTLSLYSHKSRNKMIEL